MIKFNNVKVVKVARLGGSKLEKREKADFIIRLRSSYKAGTLGHANFKSLMDVAKFKGIENRTAGEAGVVYVGDRDKIIADLDAQISRASGEALEALKAQKEFLSQFDGTKFWEITAKDMEAQENLDMLLDFNNNNCLQKKK